MSESAPEAQGTEHEQHHDGGTSGFTPPATQQELNRIIAERVKRVEAKFGDYEDLKGKAARLTEIEQASLSETEKVAQRIAAADAVVAQVPAQVAGALRTHLIALHEIPADDAELFLTANDPELLLKQVQRLVGRESDRKKHGPFVPREGTTSSVAKDNDVRETARALFGSD